MFAQLRKVVGNAPRLQQKGAEGLDRRPPWAENLWKYLDTGLWWWNHAYIGSNLHVIGEAPKVVLQNSQGFTEPPRVL